MFFSSKSVVTDEGKIDELLERSVGEVLPTKESLKKLLMSGKRLRVKLGIDPTSPNIHIGRAVTLLKLKDFQDLGHQIVFIVGDFTAVIGDTSDKDSERPMLEKGEIEKNKQTYFKQAGKILNLSKTETKNNSSWLEKLGYREIGEHANAFSVADFIARENIKKRMDEGKRVSLREILYPLMQGYDSIAVKADIEIGGTDQKFNLLSGRTLQEKMGQTPQHVLTTELILGTDGRKMSSSWGNTINLTDQPEDMFGKIMSVPDELTEVYLVTATRVPMSKVKEIMSSHPKEAKMFLAEELVRMYHGGTSAKKSRDNFENTFSKGETPKDVIEASYDTDMATTLLKAGVVSSKTEARRLLENGAIKISGTEEKITENETKPESGTVLKVGKHRFVKVI